MGVGAAVEPGLGHFVRLFLLLKKADLLLQLIILISLSSLIRFEVLKNIGKLFQFLVQLHLLLSHLFEFLLSNITIIEVLALNCMTVRVDSFLVDNVGVIALAVLISIEIAQPINHHLKLLNPLLILLVLEEVLLILSKLVFKIISDLPQEARAQPLNVFRVELLVQQIRYLGNQIVLYQLHALFILLFFFLQLLDFPLEIE